ncbi:MAG: O-antigen ligase family protein, partial [Candidatus Falkowbacteria bacterium]
KSKGALLGVAAGLIVFGLMASKKIRYAMIIILILISFGAAAYKPARDLAVSNITLTNLSGQIRRAGWADAFKMLEDGCLLTGAGLANYQTAVAPYHTQGIFIKDFSDPEAQRKLVFNEAYRTAHWQPLEIYLYPHNIFLNFWSELGLAGMLLFIWIIGKFFYLGATSYRLRVTDYKFLNIGLICAMTVIVIHGLVDVPYFKNDLAVMFWLLVAMVSMIKLESVNN